jgi:hypothetical protein
MEFAAQASRVATMVLNGDMEIDKARQYANIARTVAQALSTESARARSQKQTPELSLSEEVFEDGP